ncbi:MAG: hypothetical protein LRY27_02980 [Chitinophagales bacterium]|nr:hypothetical protein [Chitinophagales bacterium]
MISISIFEQAKDQENFPLLVIYKAMNYKYLGDYNKAINQFTEFNNSYPISGFYKEKATQETASCYWALDQKVNTQTIIKHYEEPLNTSFSDFAAYPIDSNRIQRSSLQTPKENLKGTFKSTIDFFSKEGDALKLNFPTIENDSFDYANGFYLEKTQEFYYSKCVTEHELGEKICDVYVRNFDGKNWGDEIKLPFNTLDFTETQATATLNDLGETEIYFVSDRINGHGKLDIWKCTQKLDGTYTEAQNLPSPINSIDNESTPYFDNNIKTLYFSSEWHYGFGGYDIFKSTYTESGWTEPENLGEPVNSSANDQYYYPSISGAYFASNRKGSLQLKGAACCYDVYVHQLNKVINIIPSDSLLYANNQLAKNALNDTAQFNKENILFKQFLPAVVYFHNDEPNPKTTDDKTSLSYDECYADYQDVKHAYYERYQNKEALNTWFNTVDSTYKNLQYLLSEVSKIINEKPIEMVLEGYCSPLALNDYNIHLSNRRIVSLQNYILKWNNAVLKPYFDGGYLTFKTAPFGEEKAPKTVSDDYYNIKESIFNPNAAKERKVAVIAVEIK